MLLKEKKGNEFLLSLLKKYGTLAALGAVICVFTLFEPRFFSLTNFFNITRQITVLFILGVAETYALIDGEIDLSIGWVAGFSGILAVAAQAEGYSTSMAISIALMVGLLFGLCNGFLIAIVGIESFIATLGLGQIANGLIFLYTKGAPVIGLGENFIY
jgi:ribose/xylose/arabinose/galactoside ABC-type transport system permease subunit